MVLEGGIHLTIRAGVGREGGGAAPPALAPLPGCVPRKHDAAALPSVPWGPCPNHLSLQPPSLEGTFLAAGLTEPCTLSLQAPLGHAQLHSEGQAGGAPRPPAEPPILVPALRAPGLSAAHQPYPHVRVLQGGVAIARRTRPAPALLPGTQHFKPAPGRRRDAVSSATVDRVPSSSKTAEGTWGPPSSSGGALSSQQGPRPALALMLKPNATVVMWHSPWSSGLSLQAQLPRGVDTGGRKESLPGLDTLRRGAGSGGPRLF